MTTRPARPKVIVDGDGDLWIEIIDFSGRTTGSYFMVHRGDWRQNYPTSGWPEKSIAESYRLRETYMSQIRKHLEPPKFR